MTDQQILDAIEASAHSISATGFFLNHAFCLLAEQSGVDLRVLIDEIQGLYPREENTDSTFEVIYKSSKDMLVSNLEDILKKRSHD